MEGKGGFSCLEDVIPMVADTAADAAVTNRKEAVAMAAQHLF